MRLAALTFLTIGVAVVLLGLSACRSGGGAGHPLRSVSLGTDPVALAMDFSTIVYGHDPAGDTSFFLSDLPVEDLINGTARDGQVLHIELLWLPKAGATPMDPSATNASIRHIVLSGGEVGVYGGAGFAVPKGKPGRSRLKISLRSSTVRLHESTSGFLDPLSPARIAGSFTAQHDPRLTRKIQLAISQHVTNAMGRSQFVMATND